jgi:hypothetical protein
MAPRASGASACRRCSPPTSAFGTACTIRRGSPLRGPTLALASMVRPIHHPCSIGTSTRSRTLGNAVPGPGGRSRGGLIAAAADGASITRLRGHGSGSAIAASTNSAGFVRRTVGIALGYAIPPTPSRRPRIVECFSSIGRASCRRRGPLWRRGGASVSDHRDARKGDDRAVGGG